MHLKADKAKRWLIALAAWTLAFWGIELMRSSEHSWVWFIPMLLPAMAAFGWESERKDALGKRDPTATGFHKFAIVTTEWLLFLLAVLGFYLMYDSESAWYWFTPFVVGALIILPGKNAEWNEREDRMAAEKRARKEAQDRSEEGETSLWGKALKWSFILALAALIWYVGSYFIWVWILG